MRTDEDRHARIIRRTGLCGAVITGTLVILTLAGCTGQSEAPTPSTDVSQAAPIEDEASPCVLLDGESLEALLGETPKGVEVVVPGSDLPACQFGDITKHGVQVAQTPAEEWAASLPSIAGMLQDAPAAIADPETIQQLRDAVEVLESGQKISADEACVLFSQLLELQGMEPGTTVVASYLPTKDAAIALSAQQCVGGRFTSVLVGDPEVGQDPDIVDDVMAILERIG